jgi:hypothetical protein
MMSSTRQVSFKRLLLSLAVGLGCGAFLGNIVGTELLGVANGWSSVLWVIGAMLGVASVWGDSGDMETDLSRGTGVGSALVLVLAVSCVVLLESPVGVYAASAVLVVGGAFLFWRARS